MSSSANRARHSILGAIIGDALGTTFEFATAQQAQKELKKYANFKNGLVGLGPFNLIAGQFTDDTEMALAIMSVIISHGKYDQKLVAHAYRKWYLSKPFDIGRTTSIAVAQKSREDMIHMAKTSNYYSLSNGFLMRIFGLISLYHDKTQKELIEAIISDTMLTHGNPETHAISSIYGLMLYEAIHGATASSVYALGKEKSNHSLLITTIYDTVENNRDYFVYDDRTYQISKIDSYMIGFVGYAFWLLLLVLKNVTSYKMAILTIVKFGGDTDTNACIVGAVMGAIYPDTIPKSWIKSVINCNAKSRYQNYPIADPRVWTKWLP